MKDELGSFACVVIYSRIVCECAFLSAACSLPSGPVRVQSSQNRHCWSLYAAERPPKLQNVGFSTLAVFFFFFNDFTFSGKTFQEWHYFAAAELKAEPCSREQASFSVNGCLLWFKNCSLNLLPLHHRTRSPFTNTSQRWKFHIEIPWRSETPVLTTAALFFTSSFEGSGGYLAHRWW